MSKQTNRLERFAEKFQILGDLLSDTLNKLLLPGKGGIGYVLLVFAKEDPETPLTFISDGAQADELAALLKETARRVENAEVQEGRTQ